MNKQFKQRPGTYQHECIPYHGISDFAAGLNL